MLRPYLLAAALVAIVVAAAGGVWAGIKWQQGMDARAVAEQQKQATFATLDRQRAEDRLSEKSQQLEDAAHAAPVTHPDCLPASRVQRLREYQLPTALHGAGRTP